VHYRHEILRDLQQPAVSEAVRAFAQQMRRMRDQLEQGAKLRVKEQKQRWFLDAVATYCEAVRALADALAHLAVQSSGFQMFRDFLAEAERTHKTAQRIHLFSAVPITAAIACGRAVMRQVQPTLVVYDRIGSEFRATLTVNDK